MNIFLKYSSYYLSALLQLYLIMTKKKKKKKKKKRLTPHPPQGLGRQGEEKENVHNERMTNLM